MLFLADRVILSFSNMSSVLSSIAPDGAYLSSDEARALIAQACPAKDYKGKRVLLIVPDATRTCPLGLLFRGLHEQIGGATAAFDVMIALGTHQPMSEEAICERLGISIEERRAKFGAARARFISACEKSPARSRCVCGTRG